MMSKRTAAIVVGHGSLHSDSGKSMMCIATRLREQAITPVVEAGFLNYNQPTLADAVAKSSAQGATHFVIQPYFLIDGQYATRELPALVRTIAAQRAPHSFVIAETLGYHTALVQLAQKRIQAVDPQVAPASALLVVAHGTPLESANEPIYRVAQKLGSNLGYATALVAFLDCNQPTIADAIQQLVDAGYRRIIIQPYFLHFGRHVRSDLPAHFVRAQQTYPAVTFMVAHHLDYDALLVNVTAERILASLPC